MNFTNINNGLVEGFVLIKQAEIKTSKNGSKYIDLILSDKDGDIISKIWNYNPDNHSYIKTGEIVKVRGAIEIFNEKDQLRIEKIRPLGPNDNISLDDVVMSASYKGEDMYNYLMGLVNAFDDNDLKNIVKTIFEENKEKLLSFPAAKNMHHAIRGGLLLHTASIAKMCISVCEIYTFINKDLLLAGAILHDIAKISEYQLADTGLATDFTKEGQLLGHLVKGAMMIEQTADKISADKDKAMLLEHMLLSHHGIPEYGAAVRPKFVEAEILSQLDLLDARIYAIADATKEADVGDFSKKVFGLDNRKFYKENDKEYNVDLF